MLQPVGARAGDHEPVGAQRQPAHAMARQNPANGIVDPVADHRHPRAQPLRGMEKGGKAGIDLDLIERGVQLGRRSVDELDLTCHALGRSDLPARPGLFQRLPARPGQRFQKMIGHVGARDRPVEVAENVEGHGLILEARAKGPVQPPVQASCQTRARRFARARGARQDMKPAASLQILEPPTVTPVRLTIS